MPKAISMRRMLRNDGFTLVELMMATGITLAVLAVAMATFRNAMDLNDTATLVADSSQNLRAGTNLLARDLMQAGRGIPIGGIPIPSGAGVSPLSRPGPPGGTLTFDNLTQTTLQSVITGYQLGPVVNGELTDIVTILADDRTAYVECTSGSFVPLQVYDPLSPAPAPNPCNLTSPLPTFALDGSTLDVGQYTTWITDPVNGIKAGDLLMFNDSSIQTVTQVTGTSVSFATNDPFGFNQPTAPSGSITQTIGDTSSRPLAPITVKRIQMLTYYVDAVTTPGSPRLARRLNHFPGQAMAGVVEDVTLTYDLVDGVDNPTQVPHLPATIGGVFFNSSQIRKANVQIGVRSDTRSNVRTDYLRHYSSTVVSLRSLAYIDRYR